MTSLQRRLLGALRDRQEHNLAELMSTYSANTSRTVGALKGLEEQGLVVRTEHGWKLS